MFKFSDELVEGSIQNIKEKFSYLHYTFILIGISPLGNFLQQGVGDLPRGILINCSFLRLIFQALLYSLHRFALLLFFGFQFSLKQVVYIVLENFFTVAFINGHEALVVSLGKSIRNLVELTKRVKIKQLSILI